MTKDTGNPSAPAGTHRHRRQFCVRILHRFGIVIRTSIVVVLALAALTAGLAFAANWPLPLAVMQRIGLADEGTVRGVMWEVTLPSEDAVNSVWVRAREGTALLTWSRLHEEARGRFRRVYDGGICSVRVHYHKLWRPFKHGMADGSTVEYVSISTVCLEGSLWLAGLVLGIYPTIVLLRGPMRRRWRRTHGLCLNCGYDVRLLTEPRCPECWTPTELRE